MVLDAEWLPAWVIWQQRPFPDANLLLFGGRQPALVDSGFVGHAQQTAAWARAQAGQVALVVNTHWHADHVGGNGLLQATGAGIAASAPDAAVVAHQARVDELVRRSGVIAISPAVTGLLGPSRRRHMRRWPGRCRGPSSPGPPFSATASLAWWTAMEPVTGAGC
jgi:glyoxylase-like metal-dependent hydrolase (beta-lactamase superfamily II)